MQSRRRVFVYQKPCWCTVPVELNWETAWLTICPQTPFHGIAAFPLHSHCHALSKNWHNKSQIHSSLSVFSIPPGPRGQLSLEEPLPLKQLEMKCRGCLKFTRRTVAAGWRSAPGPGEDAGFQAGTDRWLLCFFPLPSNITKRGLQSPR